MRSCRASSVATVAVVFALTGCAGPWTAAVLPGAHGARILAVETVAGRSHWNFMRAVLRALTDAGHAVTVFTPFPDGDRDNYTEVDMSAVYPMKLDMDLSELVEKFVPITSLVPLGAVLSRAFCDTVYGHERMKDVLRQAGADDKGRPRFDVVIVEPIMASDCASYAAAVLRVPLIHVVPSPSITHMERGHFGHAPNPAAVSHLFARHATPRTFADRFANTVLLVYSTLGVAYNEWTLARAHPRPYDLVTPVPPSVTFVNTHFVTEASRPMTPNVVHVGGVHLSPAKPDGIPRDVLNFIEESPHGVIYFTFGSVIKMSTMPDYILKAFKEAFAQIPQRVLWKYEGEMEDIPKNVMIKKWFPQRDILLHPKVKLFIGHGGISGVYETVDAGVPVLGFPLFYDQHRNIANLVDAGMAISMELLSVSKETFLNSILELINNKKYSENAKIVSNQFKDRPMSPEKSIVYWTEYVHRHKGALHLKSHSLDLTWYQYYLLDVVAAIFICIFIILFISYSILKVAYKYILVYLQNTKVKSD